MIKAQEDWVKLKHGDPLTPKFTSKDGLTSCQMVIFDASYDPIVEAVKNKLQSRSRIGIIKYNTTLKDNTRDNYLNHLQQELMDGANYCETLLQQKKDITQLVNNEPNDAELGKLIRQIYGN